MPEAQASEKRSLICEQAQQSYAAGKSQLAAQQFATALALFADDEKDSVEWGNFCLGFGSALVESGNLFLAETMFREAVSAFTVRNKPGGLATAYFNIGNLAAGINGHQKAFDAYTVALKTFRSARDMPGAARCLLNLASMFNAMGVPQRAHESLLEFERLDPKVRDDPEIGRSYLMQQAQWAMHENRMIDAREALQQALVPAQKTGVAAYMTETAALLARVKYQLGEGVGAMSAIEAAYEQARLDASPQAIGAASTYALALEQSGDDARAIGVYREALARIEQIRVQLDPYARAHFMEFAAGLVSAATLLLARLDSWAEAFETSERAQARATLDLMFRQQIKRQASRVIRVGLNGRMLLDSPTLAAVREDLAQANIHCLKLYRSEKQLLAWWLQPGAELRAWNASAALAPLENMLALLLRANLQEDIDATGAPRVTVRSGVAADRPAWSKVAPLLQDFWNACIPQDLRDYFSRKSGTLVICPHRDLYFVPFSAVLLSDGLPLCSRWDLAAAPSAGVFGQLDPRRDPGPDPASSHKTGALAVGGVSSQSLSIPLIPGRDQPVRVVNFEKLDATAVEAERVADLLGGRTLIGPQATPATVYAEMQKYPLLHLASHGLWDPVADVSFVLLEGGCMNARDVASRSMSIELTVLSACQTGLGMPLPDSYTGLAHSLLISGSRSVLTTLWPVGDSATLYFMENFYGGLLKGCSPARALARAQAISRDNPELADGYDWAAFGLLGRPFAAMSSAQQPLEGPIWCGGDVALVGMVPGEQLELEPYRNVIQNGAESLIIGKDRLDRLPKPH